jgi:hypothetical protein
MGRFAWIASVALAAAACNAIAGITDGQLATTGGDAGDDATTAEAGPGPGHDAGADADARAGDDATASDGPTPPPTLVCAVVPSTTLLVDDLSTYDGGASLNFIHGLWIGKTLTNKQFYVVTQVAQDDTSFLAYEVDLNAGGVLQTGHWSGVGGQAGGIGLIDFTSEPSGATIANVAFTGYNGPVSGTGSQTAVQIVPLPPQFGGLVGSSYKVGQVLANILSGRFLVQPTGEVDWLMATQGRSFADYRVAVGAGFQDDASAAPGTELAHSFTTPYDVAGRPFFDMSRTLYSLLQGVDPDGGATLFAMPDDFSDAATQAPVGASQQAVIAGARPSTTDATKAIVLALAPSGPAYTSLAGLVPPARLTSLSFDPSQLASGGTVAVSEVPADNIGRAWLGDDLVMVGSPQDGSGGLVLLWLGHDGRPVSHAGNQRKVMDDGNQVEIAAVQFEKILPQGLGATLDLAWMEHVSPDGGAGKYDRIYAAQATCTPAP